MVAENLAMTVVDDNPPFDPGREFTVSAYFTVGSAVETGDSWTASNLLPSQKVTIVSGRTWGADLDTNSSPTATQTIGDGTDTDGYLASKVAGGGEQTQELSFDGELIGAVPAGRDLTLTLGGSVATAASSGTRWVEVTYRCTDNARFS